MTDLRHQSLHFDCISGAAGDMTVAALIDCGVPEQVVTDAVVALGLDRERLQIERIVKGGISAVDVRVTVDDLEGAHGDEHHHHHHYREIRSRVAGAPLDSAVIDRALDIFDRLARAEAHLHGTRVDEVAFHEVGAVDSLVDIVGAAAALTWLAPTRVTASAVAMGQGSVTCAHGRLPVPSPAAIEIMREVGALVVGGGINRELCTPTGAAILASVVSEWGVMPELVPLAIGYGAGDVDLEDRPNVLRAVIGRGTSASAALYRIEANIDDMSPELCEHVGELLFAGGAVDVWWTPITMKKSRPAILLSVLAPAQVRDQCIALVLRETTTLGVRYDPVSRRTLEREVIEVDTRFGRLPIKIARLAGEIVNVAPEYGPCRQAALRHAVALKRVFQEAIAAFSRASS